MSLPFDPGVLVLVAIVAFLVSGALSPLETLGWWAGWYGDEVDAHEAAREARREAGPDDARGAVPHARSGHAAPERYLVFLGGINSVSDETLTDRERGALAALRQALPETCLVVVFPYAVTNRALTGARAFGAFWRWSLRLKLSRRRIGQITGMLINLRNMWQVAVSADRRYGPFYNRGSAQLIVQALVRQGYELGSSVPVVLMGYSGGGQVAIGAAPFVRHQTLGTVTVVSLGGVLAADPGLLEADHVLHLYGRRDRVHRLGQLCFPGRWPLLPHSPWNQARAHGTLRSVEIGPSAHTGVGGYFDADTPVDAGRTFLGLTVDVVAAAARDPSGPLPIAAPRLAPGAT